MSQKVDLIPLFFIMVNKTVHFLFSLSTHQTHSRVLFHPCITNNLRHIFFVAHVTNAFSDVFLFSINNSSLVGYFMTFFTQDFDVLIRS